MTASEYFTIRLKKTVVFSLIAVALLLGFLELGARLLIAVKRQVVRVECNHPNEIGCPLQPFQAEQDAATRFDPYTGFGWKAGYSGEWLAINSDGFRGAELATEPDGEILRVAVLGSSAVVGVGVHNNETIPYYLEQTLEAELNQDIEVINAGITGSIAAQDFTNFALNVLPLQPDILVVYNGRNDAYFGLSPHWEPNLTEALRTISERELRSEPSLGAWIRYQTGELALAQGFRQIVYLLHLTPSASPDLDGQLEYHPEALGVYERQTRKMLELAEAERIPTLLVVQPSLAAGNKVLTSSEERYVEWARSAGYFDLLQEHYMELPAAAERAADGFEVPVIDLTGFFDSYEQAIYLDEVHLRAEGNRAVAGRLAQEILLLIE